MMPSHRKLRAADWLAPIDPEESHVKGESRISMLGFYDGIWRIVLETGNVLYGIEGIYRETGLRFTLGVFGAHQHL